MDPIKCMTNYDDIRDVNPATGELVTPSGMPLLSTLASIRDAADAAHINALEVVARGNYTREDLSEMDRTENALLAACDAHAKAATS